MFVIDLLDVLSLLEQLPTSTMLILVLSVSGITILVLVNKSACDRLIRILRVIFGRNDNKPPRRKR